MERQFYTRTLITDVLGYGFSARKFDDSEAQNGLMIKRFQISDILSIAKNEPNE